MSKSQTKVNFDIIFIIHCFSTFFSILFDIFLYLFSHFWGLILKKVEKIVNWKDKDHKINDYITCNSKFSLEISESHIFHKIIEIIPLHPSPFSFLVLLTSSSFLFIAFWLIFWSSCPWVVSYLRRWYDFILWAGFYGISWRSVCYK